MTTFMRTITGSFAYPAAENPTIAVMEAAYAHHGLAAQYLNCEVPPERLGDAVRGAVAMGWAGFNCSIPNKVEVIQYLDGLAESARIIGAVNCVVIGPDGLIGHNTDGQGFVESLRTVADPSGASMTIFGAGGAARAIAVESALAGASRITIVNRSVERGAEVARIVAEQTGAVAGFEPWTPSFSVDETSDIVVNATSIGLFPDVDAQLDLDPDSLRPGMVVADVIHNPPVTHLLRAAKGRGCTTLDGRGMLVNQARINMRLWTGVDADGAIMRRVLDDLFGA
jgi:shikimate dehydrogenase